MRTLPRRLATKQAVADHYGLPLDECLRCGIDHPTERAHIIDRCYFEDDVPNSQVDGVGNLAPLCPGCHAMQPAFKPGEESLAWAWLRRDAEAYVYSWMVYDEGFHKSVKIGLLEGVTIESIEFAVDSLIESQRIKWSRS